MMRSWRWQILAQRRDGFEVAGVFVDLERGASGGEGTGRERTAVAGRRPPSGARSTQPQPDGRVLWGEGGRRVVVSIRWEDLPVRIIAALRLCTAAPSIIIFESMGQEQLAARVSIMKF